MVHSRSSTKAWAQGKLRREGGKWESWAAWTQEEDPDLLEE
jgi:hypothetical protein